MGNKKRAGQTKQGVRDLDSLPSKSVGVVLSMPPSHQMCKHKRVVRPNELYGDSKCLDCGKMWYYDGTPYSYD